MTHTKFSPTLLTTLAGLLFITGCSGTTFNGAEQARPYEVRHPITLVEKEESVQISIKSKGGHLSEMQKAKVKSFIYGYNEKATDNIVISVPESGIKAAAARTATKQLTEVIAETGIAQSDIMIGTYQPSDIRSNNITIRFKTLQAKGPKCDNNWSENLADAYNNTSWKGLGCSTRSNLAAMISNPNDLVEMRPMGPAHAGRRVDTIDKYALGQSTGASRSADEIADSTAQ